MRHTDAWTQGRGDKIEMPSRPCAAPLQRHHIALLLPLLLCLASLLVFARAGRTHTFGTYATETDFYHLYAPDAARIASWRFPENPYQGPGYPAALALITPLTGDVFTSGKWLSIASAALAGFATFLLFERLFGYWTGIGAQLLVLAGEEFAVFAINATTDVFFLLLCLACLVAFMSDRIDLSARWRTALTAALASLAYLTRYNGLFLAATFLIGITALNFFRVDRRERLRLVALFATVFLLVASPWLYANYKHRGSPFYNTNYLNIATEYYRELADAQVNQDGTRPLEEKFHSLGDVLRYDPRRMIAHYPENLFDQIQKTVTSNLVNRWVGWAAVIGIGLALIERRSRPVILALISGVIYLMLMALTHWETRYFFYIMALYAGFAVYAAGRPLELLRSRGWLKHPAFALVPVALVLTMWALSVARTRDSLARFLASHPAEVLRACEYFRDQQIRGARVMARKPHVAFICGQEWVFFPVVKSLDELREQIRENRVDYVLFSSVEAARRREVKELKNPAAAPVWLEPVWVSSDPPVVLYRARLQSTDERRARSGE